uniref:Uncharacterized protein LOC111131304 n=1 Tax=Crassostrea virginica TaxID=6565 RepID=A0A8B8E1S5_CRAVI|nr:uncharacterized protein LOC111131304 [Crassostrea virginica]
MFHGLVCRKALLCFIITFHGSFHGLECSPITAKSTEQIKLHCGETKSLMCYEYSEENKKNVMWFKNGVFLTFYNYLELLSVSSRNEGLYSCFNKETRQLIKQYEVTLQESSCRKD